MPRRIRDYGVAILALGALFLALTRIDDRVPGHVAQMAVDASAPSVRFHHVGGITKGMDVEWSFQPVEGGTHVRLVHAWDGPRWPLIGVIAATAVIGPVFVHGIASRTLAGLAREAERHSRPSPVTRHPSPPTA